MGVLRRVQPHGAGGAVRGGAADPDHPGGRGEEGAALHLRRRRPRAQQDVQHLHHDESLVSLAGRGVGVEWGRLGVWLVCVC